MAASEPAHGTFRRPCSATPFLPVIPDPASALRMEEPAAFVRVGTIGRLAEQKGLPYLLEAAEIVSQKKLGGTRNPSGRRGDGPGDRRAGRRARLEGIEFSVAGDGPMRGRIEDEIARRGLEGRFRLVGAVAKPWDYLAGLDVFVLPSLWEGMPYVLLEAMGAGLPVVAADVGGVADLIPGAPPEEAGRHVLCKHGLKVLPRDAAGLAGAIVSLAQYPWMRQMVGEAARERVLDEFSLERMEIGSLGVYGEAVGR